MTADNRLLALRRRHRQNKHICDFESAGGPAVVDRVD